MSRRLVASLACRAGGSRLYGKPLQNLDAGVTILDLILQGARAGTELDDIQLCISEGVENQIFVDYAKRYDTGYIFGDQKDVLLRLVKGARAGRATDVFRITTECPFIPWEYLAPAWDLHCRMDNDLTVIDYLPCGVGFEIYKAEVLERSHREGNDRERSEFCSLFVVNHIKEFKVHVVEPMPGHNRPDLRLTVDYPEDLILCRGIYRALKDKAPRIPVDDILAYLDRHPEEHRIVAPYHDPGPYWVPLIQGKGKTA